MEERGQTGKGIPALRKDPARFLFEIAIAAVTGALVGAVGPATMFVMEGRSFDESFFPAWGFFGFLIGSISVAPPFAERVQAVFGQAQTRRHGWLWLVGAGVMAILIYALAKQTPGAALVAEYLPFGFLVMLLFGWAGIAPALWKAVRGQSQKF
jgi:hypothetical protein